MTAAVSVRPRLLVTGASGFVGRHLLEILAPRWQIFALDRRSRVEGGIPRHPNIRWEQVDLKDEAALTASFARIRDGGGADALIHLAAYYDFTGEDHPEYRLTNLDGTRRVLELSRGLGLQRFFFTSSLAACPFPDPGETVTEATAPSGEHIYSQSKRQGEEMVARYRDSFPSVILRFPALFSDWCQYEPLSVFLETWLSRRWNARVLAGRGKSALPYLHVRDVTRGMEVALNRMTELEPEEVLALSWDGAISHLELFRTATTEYFGHDARPPRFLPRSLCAAGMWGRDRVGRLLGERPFERPWMARYIDEQLTVDASRTRGRLGWQPRPRLGILHRIPFMVENFKSDPVEWQRRNTRVAHLAAASPNLRIYRLMEDREEEIIEAFHRDLMNHRYEERLPHYRDISEEDHAWHHRLILQNLMNSIRTREKSVFVTYCRNLAERRYRQGFAAHEVGLALSALEQACLQVIRDLPEAQDLLEEVESNIRGIVRFGIDRILDTYERLQTEADLREAVEELRALEAKTGSGVTETDRNGAGDPVEPVGSRKRIRERRA